MARILRYLILGGLGGLLFWVLVEPIEYLTPHGDPTMHASQQILLGGLFGLFVGLALGVAEALSGVSPRDAVKSVVIGIGIGFMGGAFGLPTGNTFVYRPIQQLAHYQPDNPLAPLSLGGFLLLVIGRSAGWAIIGGFVGLAQGVSTLSTKKMINGVVGGFLGGAVGGFVFGILSTLVVADLLRLIGFTTTAGATGLFIGFVDEMSKKAWIVHLKGRNEGRQFEIFKQETVVGRDELVDIPVFGDPDFEPRHFMIRADQKRHLLKDLNSTAGTMVNGQKVQQQLLKDGDIIQVGMTKFLFRDKATRSVVPRQYDAYSATGAHIPTSSHVCPFCGGIKDASGNCSCSVGGAPVQSPNVPPATGQTVQTTVGMSMPTQMNQMAPDPFAGTPMGAPLTGPSMASPGSGARLVAVSGPYAGHVYTLGDETSIGRQTDQMVALSTDNTVSRQHARIANEGGQFVLYDNGSANGTHVNNNKISRHVLMPGDLVQVGSTKFRYEL